MDMESLIIKEICGHLPETQAIYLFGSYASGHARPDSDIDIAVLLPFARAGSFSITDQIGLANHLAISLGRQVDLVNLRRVATTFQAEVISSGRRIHAPDSDAAERFVLFTLSSYQKLNYERTDILAMGAAGGRFYQL